MYKRRCYWNVAAILFYWSTIDSSDDLEEVDEDHDDVDVQFGDRTNVILLAVLVISPTHNHLSVVRQELGKKTH